MKDQKFIIYKPEIEEDLQNTKIVQETADLIGHYTCDTIRIAAIIMELVDTFEKASGMNIKEGIHIYRSKK